jgi:hypothetical protein
MSSISKFANWRCSADFVAAPRPGASYCLGDSLFPVPLPLTNTKPGTRSVCAKSESALRAALPTAGGFDRAAPGRFRAPKLHAWSFVLFFRSFSAFSRISSTARSRGRPAALLLLMISARSATTNTWPPKSIRMARLRKAASDRTPSIRLMKSTCSESSHGAQALGHCLQFPQIAGSLPEQEIEIEGRDRRSVQCGRRIADHNGFQALFVEYPGQREECGAGIHRDKPIVRPRMFGTKPVVSCHACACTVPPR